MCTRGDSLSTTLTDLYTRYTEQQNAGPRILAAELAKHTPTGLVIISSSEVSSILAEVTQEYLKCAVKVFGAEANVADAVQAVVATVGGSDSGSGGLATNTKEVVIIHPSLIPSTASENDELWGALASRSPTLLVRDPSLTDEAQLAVCEAIASHEFEVLCACAVPCDCGTASSTQAVKYEASQISLEFLAVLRVVCPTVGAAPPIGPGSYFVSLTFPDVSSAVQAGRDWKPPDWVKDSKGGPLHNALELRTDLLANQTPAYIRQQLAVIRRHSQGCPIVFTVRTQNQGGDFPDDEVAMFKVMALGLRYGCEYIDMECCWSIESRYAFLRYKESMYAGSRMIGSYHLVKKTLNEYSDYEVQALFHECAKAPEGCAINISKVVGKARDVHCSIRIHQAALEAKKTLPATVESIIAINTTDPGRLSRALNVMLGPTPVAHPALPGKAAPGQLSALEIEQVRTTLGLEANPFQLAESRKAGN